MGIKDETARGDVFFPLKPGESSTHLKRPMTAGVKDNRNRLFIKTKRDKRTPGDLPLTPAGTIRSRDISVIRAAGLHSGQAKQKGSDTPGSRGHTAGDRAPVARVAASHTWGDNVSEARFCLSGKFRSFSFSDKLGGHCAELPFTFICLTNTQCAKFHSKFCPFKVNLSISKYKCWLRP